MLLTLHSLKQKPVVEDRVFIGFGGTERLAHLIHPEAADLVVRI